MNKEIIDYKGYKIDVSYDESPMRPDEWSSNVILVFNHRDFWIQHPDFEADAIFEAGEEVKGYHVFRCYAYIHSGVMLSVGPNSKWPDQRWDVSFKGFWLVERQKGAWRRSQARKLAEAFCEEWNTYLSGEIYRFTIQDREGEFIDSCGGYYSMNDLVADAKDVIDLNIKTEHEIS